MLISQCFSLSNNETCLLISLHTRSILWRIMIATTRSDELRHSPAARDRKLSSRVIAIIIRSLNILLRTG
jgi:hypothetical protein